MTSDDGSTVLDGDDSTITGETDTADTGDTADTADTADSADTDDTDDTADTADTADSADSGEECGNGVVEGAEECDGGDLGGADCAGEGFGGGALQCNMDCTLDTSNCTSCRNDVGDDASEECDGTDLGESSVCFDLNLGTAQEALGCADACDCGNQGVTCTAAQLDNETCIGQGFDGGTLMCNSPTNCNYDTSACYSCGDGNIDPGEECDGTNIGTETCVSEGFPGGGTLTCDNSCNFVTSACVLVANPYVACLSPNLQITGAGPGTANPSAINIPAVGTITDVNVYTDCLHTWPGDLQFRVNLGATTSLIMDQPGVPAGIYGCSTDNLDLIFDDEGSPAVEGVCKLRAPGISGVVSPNAGLSAFDGLDMAGDWKLAIDDMYPLGDDGTLLEWCVEIAWN